MADTSTLLNTQPSAQDALKAEGVIKNDQNALNNTKRVRGSSFLHRWLLLQCMEREQLKTRG